MAKVTEYLVKRIHALRQEKLSIRVIGMRVGLSHDTVGKVLRGQRGVTADEFGRPINGVNGWSNGVLRKRMAETGTFRRPS